MLGGYDIERGDRSDTATWLPALEILNLENMTDRCEKIPRLPEEMIGLVGGNLRHQPMACGIFASVLSDDSEASEYNYDEGNEK